MSLWRKRTGTSVLLLFSLFLGAQAREVCAAELIASFDPELGQLPESVTLDCEGNLYWSMSNTVWRRTPDGNMSVFGTLPIEAFALGVKVGPDGCVYTVSTSLTDAAGAFVWRICDEGYVEQTAELDHDGGPNDLVIDRKGYVYVTDPFLGRIWKVGPDGSVQVWLEHPLLQGDPENPVLVFHSLGADGIAFDRKQQNIYVSNLDHGKIIRIRLKRNGSAGNVSVWASDPLLVGADGLAFNRWGNLFAAVNAQDTIVSVSLGGNVRVIETGGLLDGPSSLVFGAGRNADTLFVTSSAFSRAFGYIPGDPHPALLKIE